jgi:beta-aspartyl-peptidase (threonine type)
VARAHGFEPSTLEAMTTDAARRHLAAARQKHAAEGFAGGTVGAVARDARGHVAAATSTGGTTNKSAGRVGDSPILGAGNYADDGAGACSVTGQGEFVMRTCLAKTAIDWMREGAHPEDAARTAIRFLERRTGGTGGLILMGPRRHLGWARSTETMSWSAMAESWPEAKSGY